MYIYIKSMSEYQSKIYDKITSASSQIDKHIIKLLLFPNTEYTNHWMHEIWSFLHEVDTLKRTHKFPKYKFIKKALSTHNDILHNYVKLVISTESNLDPTDVDISKIKFAIEKYQDWLAKQLSSEGIVLQNEVKTKLTEILDINS